MPMATATVTRGNIRKPSAMSCMFHASPPSSLPILFLSEAAFDVMAIEQLVDDRLSCRHPEGPFLPTALADEDEHRPVEDEIETALMYALDRSESHIRTFNRNVSHRFSFHQRQDGPRLTDDFVNMR